MNNSLEFSLTLENLPQLLNWLKLVYSELVTSSQKLNTSSYLNYSFEEALILVYTGELIRWQFATFAQVRQFLNTYSLHQINLTHEQHGQLFECENVLNAAEIQANEKRALIHQIKHNLEHVLGIEKFIQKKMKENFDGAELLQHPQRFIQQYSEFLQEKIAAVSDIPTYFTSLTASKNYHITPQMQKAYSQLGQWLPELCKQLFLSESNEMMQETASKLGIYQNGAYLLDTQFERGVLLDISFFQHRIAGKNLPERYYEEKSQTLAPELAKLLLSYKEAHFSLLDVIQPVSENGLIVFDRLQQKEFLLMDKPLYQTSLHNKNTIILTHYFQMTEFAATTGTAVPLNIRIPIAKDMLQLFEKLIQHHQGNIELSNEEYLELIFEIYKIAFSEGIIKSVTSPLLPLGEAYLKTQHAAVH